MRESASGRREVLSARAVYRCDTAGRAPSRRVTEGFPQIAAKAREGLRGPNNSTGRACARAVQIVLAGAPKAARERADDAYTLGSPAVEASS